MADYKRRQLSAAEDYHLWVACGGICSFEDCNKRLIQSTEGSLINVGEKAHIIGHAENSARHEYMEEYGYTQEMLENVSNLMLMCHEHHKWIDGHATRSLFPPDRLFKMKEEHEKKVASWSEFKKKKSIAIIHKRLGGPLIDIEYAGESPFILLDAVEDQIEFIDFSTDGWEEGKRSNERLYKKFVEKIKEKKANVAEVFPLSPIPLLIHFGSLLTDTVPYSIYQFDREAGLWVSDNPGAKKEVELTCAKYTKRNNELAVLISVSGIIKASAVNEVLENEYDTLEFVINDPGLKRVLYREDVLFIQSRVKEEVEKLLQTQDYNKIHLFYAGPAGLAIELGRGINSNIWSEVYLYQYNNRKSPKYQYALSI
ncbi:SAVED domain-containing protein [Cytobacillus pseudoceanisediminis]|uniref:SAVED domain-containing protein n=1 Tax=Cytobacillus pseudoceanisediminis TaxID=3051614 RepID=UPI003646DBE4